MRIGELSQRTGVSVRSLRYYEQQGLLRSSRTPSGHRRFECSDVDAVIQIQELFAAGLCSKRIVDLLPLISDPAAANDVAAVLAQERDRLVGGIRDLELSLEVIDALCQRVLRVDDNPR